MTISKEDVARVEKKISLGAKIAAVVLGLFGIKAKKGPRFEPIK